MLGLKSCHYCKTAPPTGRLVAARLCTRHANDPVALRVVAKEFGRRRFAETERALLARADSIEAKARA